MKNSLLKYMSGKDLILFDVDGTLAPSALCVTEKIGSQFIDMMRGHQDKFDFGIVGGSQREKIESQLATKPELLKMFKWIFSENGLVAHKRIGETNGDGYGDGAGAGAGNGDGEGDEEEIHHQTLVNYVPERTLRKIIDWCLIYIAALDLPVKRGKFIDFRSGLIYITPCGSNVSQIEREQFAEYDAIHKVREGMIEELYKNFGATLDFEFQLGGQIGLGAHPKGWNKTYSLQHLKNNEPGEGKYFYKTIYFIGDRCQPGGNDYPLFAHPDVKGYATRDPEHTLEILAEIL